jgi:hypothetical protein
MYLLTSVSFFLLRPTQAPGYRKIINSDHIDLSMIQKNLKEVNYKTNKDFVRDVRSIFKNTESFYHRSSDQHKASKELASHFELLVKKMLPQLSSKL